MKFSGSWIGSVFFCLICFDNAANANDVGKATIDVSGFFSAVATRSINDVEDSNYSDDIATPETSVQNRENRVGLQISSTLSDQLKFTGLWIAHGGSNHFASNVDWAYLDYQISENFNVHVGKYKIPQFLVSDYADVGFAYPWVRPPRDVYATNPLVAISGVNLFYNVPFSGNNVLFQLFAGSGEHEVYLPAQSIANSPVLMAAGLTPGTQATVNTKNTQGVNIVFTRGNFTFRAGQFVTTVFAKPLIEDTKGSFSGIGTNFEIGRLVVYSEYIDRHTPDKTIVAFPDQKAWYATLGLKLGNSLTYVTQSKIKEGDNPSDLAIKERSRALGMRFELGASSALKFEAMQVEPEPGNYGLYSTVVEKGKVYSITLDSVF